MMQTEMARYRQLENWFATPFGCYVAVAEADFFARKLAVAAGEAALQIGWPQWPLLQQINVPNGLTPAGARFYSRAR